MSLGREIGLREVVVACVLGGFVLLSLGFSRSEVSVSIEQTLNSRRIVVSRILGTPRRGHAGSLDVVVVPFCEPVASRVMLDIGDGTSWKDTTVPQPRLCTCLV